MICVYRKAGEITRIEASAKGKASLLEEHVRLMVRWEKAQSYMESESVPVHEKEAQVPNLKQLTQDISIMMHILEKVGEEACVEKMST